MYDDEKEYGKYRSCVFFSYDLSDHIHRGIDIKYLIYGEGDHPSNKKRCRIGYAQFRNIELSSSAVARALNIKTCTCKIPMEPKSGVIEWVRSIVDPETLVIEGIPYTGTSKGGRPKKHIGVTLVNGLTPVLYIRKRVEEGWTYSDFYERDPDYAATYMSTIDSEIDILKNMNRSTNHKGISKDDLRHIIALRKEDHDNDVIALAYHGREQKVINILRIYEWIQEIEGV
jgi:hypothetical protein